MPGPTNTFNVVSAWTASPTAFPTVMAKAIQNGSFNDPNSGFEILLSILGKEVPGPDFRKFTESNGTPLFDERHISNLTMYLECMPATTMAKAIKMVENAQSATRYHMFDPADKTMIRARKALKEINNTGQTSTYLGLDELKSAVVNLINNKRFFEAKALIISRIKYKSLRSPFILTTLSYCCIKLKQYRTAMIFTEKALALAPDFKSAQQSKSKIDMRTNSNDFSAYLELVNLGVELYSQNRHQEALQIFVKAYFESRVNPESIKNPALAFEYLLDCMNKIKKEYDTDEDFSAQIIYIAHAFDAEQSIINSISGTKTNKRSKEARLLMNILKIKYSVK